MVLRFPYAVGRPRESNECLMTRGVTEMKQIGFHVPETDDAPASASVLLGMSGVALRLIANLLVQVSSA